MIKVNDLRYSYQEKEILTDFTLSMNEKNIIGCWGRNGAGKTTLMKLLAGHLKPDQGDISVFGFHPYNNPKTSNHVCYMQEEHPFSIIWKIKDAIRFGSYFNPNFDMDYAKELLTVFQLDENQHVTKLSKGMKSALQFIIGISSKADFTILDEPTNGLDAAMRKKFYKVLMESFEDHPRFILLSSHHIEEIQPFCDSLVAIHNGKVLLNESMETMRAKGVWISGEKDSLTNIVHSYKVLEKNMMGSKMKVMLDEMYTEELKKSMTNNRLSMEPVSLQDYLLNITETRNEVNV